MLQGNIFNQWRFDMRKYGAFEKLSTGEFHTNTQVAQQISIHNG